MTEILNRYNNEGIFPTDEELQVIVNEDENYNEPLEVELELLRLAENPNHPYHNMTLPREFTIEDIIN
jgi:hypothetical protein|tara:strand:+ start:519 stop:722 length:204 start_codon:yes stop_codon:yes gene_type:complete